MHSLTGYKIITIFIFLCDRAHCERLEIIKLLDKKYFKIFIRV